MNRKTFAHRAGQEFETFVEFVTKDNKKLILAKSMYSIRPSRIEFIEDQDGKYFVKNQWFVFYGERIESEYSMGAVRLSYPTSAKTLTLGTALLRFNSMVKNINYVNFLKIDHIDKHEKCITYE